MSDNAQGQNPGEEPSMEDILASIRRILSEDGEEEEAQAAPEPAPGWMGRSSLPPTISRPSRPPSCVTASC